MTRTDPDDPRFLHRKFDRPGSPTVSVVIPSLDGHRGGNVELLLESLVEQTHRPLEAIVAIGLRPQGRARNRAADTALGDYLLFIDDDVELRDEETIAKLLRAIESGEGAIGMVGPTPRLLTYSNDFQRRASSQIPRFSTPTSESSSEASAVPHSCFLIPRDLYFECDGESEIHRGETDRDLRERIGKQGLTIVRVEDVLIGHPAPENWDALFSLAFRKGEAKAETARYRSKTSLPGASDPLAPMTEVETFFSRAREWGVRMAGAVAHGHWIRIADELGWLAGWLSGKLLDLNRNRVLFEKGVKVPIGALGEIRRLKNPPPPALRFLTYHRVDDIPGYPLCVPKKEFQRQLDYLIDQGLLIGFEEAMSILRDGKPILRNRVALTFDDGFRDSCTNALPILEERGATACFFLVTDRIGSLGEFSWMKKHGSPNYHILNWDQVRLLRDSGMTIGSHTARHDRLSLLHDDEARAALMESFETLMNELGGSPRFLAYPYGREGDYGQREIEMLREAGIEFAFGAHYGGVRAGADSFRLPRIDIDASDGFEIFKSKVQGDFDSVWAWGKKGKQHPVEEPI